MNLTGIYCTILMGPTIPIPLPSVLTEIVHQIEVIHKDSGRSGFKIDFYAGRSGITNAFDYTIFRNPLVKLFNRVNILVTINGIQRTLMDGFITDIQINDSDNQGIITICGQDVSLMMDRKQVKKAYPALSENLIAAQIIGRYAQYQLIPDIIPPPLINIPNPTDWIPQQHDTDYVYLKKLAKRFGYVFYVVNGPAPRVNTAYWGPSKRVGVPQPALAVNLGYGRNVNDIRFRQNALAAVTVSGEVQDRTTLRILPFQALVSTSTPLSAKGALVTNTQELLLDNQAGLSYSEAQARAQGITNRSRDRVVVAEGSLNTESYGRILQARSLIGVQGAGLSNDGLYYVEQVTHTLRSGYYTQQFTLTRDGVGSTVPAVIT
jgi:hypothetical protein